MIANNARRIADLDLRSFRPGDEAAIAALFAVSFDRELPRDFWAWRYLDHPAGGPWIELAWDGDILAAHYAVSAAIVSIEERDVPAALSMTTMTHPDYRGRGLFPALARQLYARFAEFGGQAVYGFPNANSHRGFVRDLGWCDLLEIPTLRMATTKQSEERALSGAVAVTPAFDARFDRLWSRIAPAFGVWLRRDADWLNWRFNKCPVHAYTIAAWEDRDEIRGWAVVKRFGERELDLVDLVAEDAAVATDLVRWAQRHAERQGLVEIATWCPLRARWRAALESSGFTPAAPVTYLGARALSGSSSAVERADHWGFSMADSDVY